ncbi:MAG TPA: hypothetical protein VMT72_13745, partial [Pseudolabrys sp.]|nr:hypothetical protein [Pseudolabrys sp.]
RTQPWHSRNGLISKHAHSATNPLPFGTVRKLRLAELFGLEILVIVAARGLAQRLRGHYMARHRVSAERLGLAAIDAPD